MSILNLCDSLILIVDIQEKLVNAVYNKDELLKSAEALTNAGKILNIPIIATEQYPKGLGHTINSIAEYIDKDNIFEKISFSALDNENIKSTIAKHKRHQIILCGIETHICVNQTAAALIAENYEVNIIKNASSSRNEYEHNAGLQRMKDNGANIITLEIALFELLKTAKHPDFKEIQSLIK